jgi:hypothetical protein
MSEICCISFCTFINIIGCVCDPFSKPFDEFKNLLNTIGFEYRRVRLRVVILFNIHSVVEIFRHL